MPDAYRGTCDECGRDEVVIVVFVDHDDAGAPLGPFTRQCWPCLGRDGDPLHRLR